jgi:hypothetical protein
MGFIPSKVQSSSILGIAPIEYTVIPELPNNPSTEGDEGVESL